MRGRWTKTQTAILEGHCCRQDLEDHGVVVEDPMQHGASCFLGEAHHGMCSAIEDGSHKLDKLEALVRSP